MRAVGHLIEREGRRRSTAGPAKKLKLTPSWSLMTAAGTPTCSYTARQFALYPDRKIWHLSQGFGYTLAVNALVRV
jgi:hypothetical protein